MIDNQQWNHNANIVTIMDKQIFTNQTRVQHGSDVYFVLVQIIGKNNSSTGPRDCEKKSVTLTNENHTTDNADITNICDVCTLPKARHAAENR